MKKLILLILTTALIAVPVLSCASDDNGEQPGGTETGRGNGNEEIPGYAELECDLEEELAFPDLPQINFGGYEFRILNSAPGSQPHILHQLIAEAETGEALNDAIFRRNRRMEERFGFNLVMTSFPTLVAIRDTAQTSIMAASDDFDLMMMLPQHALPMAQDGMLEMIDRIPYIDLSRPWWDQDMVRDFSIGGRVFFTSGDFSFNQYSVAMPIFFNKQIHADLGLDCPYTLVHEGRWTIDRFAEQARQGNRDLNNDGIMNHEDQWGFASIATLYTLGFMNGMGARYVINDADGMPVLNMNTQGFISRFHIIADIFSEGWIYDFHRPDTPTRTEVMFQNNQALFWLELMNWATILRGMDNDFGILPVPKLNEQQEYHITAAGNPHVMSIPVTTADLGRTGIILEALNAESRLTTLTVYYDTMLVNQLLNRDEESAEMLEIIFANRVYETGRFFWETNISIPVAEAMRDMNRDIVSVIERHEAAAIADIERTVESFLGN